MRRRLAIVVLLLAIVAFPGQRARAADPERRSVFDVVGYVLYPIGLAFDRLVLGPPRWLARLRPVQVLLGIEVAAEDAEIPDAPVAQGPPDAGSGDSSAAARPADATDQPSQKPR